MLGGKREGEKEKERRRAKQKKKKKVYTEDFIQSDSGTCGLFFFFSISRPGPAGPNSPALL